MSSWLLCDSLWSEINWLSPMASIHSHHFTTNSKATVTLNIFMHIISCVIEHSERYIIIHSLKPRKFEATLLFVD